MIEGLDEPFRIYRAGAFHGTEAEAFARVAAIYRACLEDEISDATAMGGISRSQAKENLFATGEMMWHWTRQAQWALAEMVSSSTRPLGVSLN